MNPKELYSVNVDHKTRNFGVLCLLRVQLQRVRQRLLQEFGFLLSSSLRRFYNLGFLGLELVPPLHVYDETYLITPHGLSRISWFP